MKIIVYSRPDGGVTEVLPSPFARLCSGFVSNGQVQTLEQPCPLDTLQRTFGAIEPVYAETEDEFVQRIGAKDVPADATNVTYLDFEALPTDVTTRDAWEIVGGEVVVNAERARALRKVVLSQDLMAQFTADDLTKIKAAIEDSIQFWGLWSALQTQKDPMLVTNARFLRGWGALVQVLGQPRMDAIATALGITL